MCLRMACTYVLQHTYNSYKAGWQAGGPSARAMASNSTHIGSSTRNRMRPDGNQMICLCKKTQCSCVRCVSLAFAILCGNEQATSQNHHTACINKQSTATQTHLLFGTKTTK